MLLKIKINILFMSMFIMEPSMPAHMGCSTKNFDSMYGNALFSYKALYRRVRFLKCMANIAL